MESKENKQQISKIPIEQETKQEEIKQVIETEIQKEQPSENIQKSNQKEIKKPNETMKSTLKILPPKEAKPTKEIKDPKENKEINTKKQQPKLLTKKLVQQMKIIEKEPKEVIEPPKRGRKPMKKDQPTSTEEKKPKKKTETVQKRTKKAIEKKEIQQTIPVSSLSKETTENVQLKDMKELKEQIKRKAQTKRLTKDIKEMKEVKENKELKETKETDKKSNIIQQLPPLSQQNQTQTKQTQFKNQFPIQQVMKKQSQIRLPLPKRLTEKTKSKTQQKNAEHKRHSREQQSLFICCLIGLLSGEQHKLVSVKVPPKFKKEGVAQCFQVMKIDDIVFPERQFRTEAEYKVINKMSEIVTQNIPIEKMKKTYSQPDRVRFVRYDYIYPFTDEKGFYEFGKYMCEMLKRKMSSIEKGQELILDETIQKDISVHIHKIMNNIADSDTVSEEEQHKN